MVVEMLRFAVRAGTRDAFVDRNERIWTPALRRQPGYHRHEVLLSRSRPDEVVILVYWRALRDMRAFPEELETELNGRMEDLIVHQERAVFDAVPGTSPDEHPAP